jgi:hydroxyacylglutathione hydrolase
MTSTNSVYSGRLRQFDNDVVLPLTPWTVNTYLVRGERPILVDTGQPSDADKIKDALTAFGVLPTDLSLILITHGHYDHFGSAASLQALSKSPVAVPEQEAHWLESGTTPKVYPQTWMGYLLNLMPSSAMTAPPVTPDVRLIGNEVLAAYGVEGRVISTPGHTPHSVSLLVDGFAVIGDLLAGNLLLPNRPEWPYFINDRADKQKIRPSVERLVDEGARVFFPGHGLPFNRESVLRWLSRTKG